MAAELDVGRCAQAFRRLADDLARSRPRSALDGSPAELIGLALAPGFTDHTLPAGRPQGPSGPAAASRTFRAAVPDLGVAIEKLVVAGDMVTVHMVFTGHFTGTLGAETDGGIETRGPGEFIVLPPGRPHRLFNDSGATTREFLLCTPAVFDRFVAAAGTPVAPFVEPVPMSDAARQRLVATAPDYGVRLLGSARPDSPIASTVAQREVWNIPGARFEVLARLGDRDEDLVLTRQQVGPGSHVVLHRHADPECVFNVQGALDLFLEGDSWRTLGPDEVLNIRPGQPHALGNASREPALLLTVTTVRMARVLAETDSPVKSTS